MVNITNCSFCDQVKKIVSKGLCGACNGRLRNNGSLEYKRKPVKNICEVEDCGKYVVSHGLCDKHRVRLRRHGHIEQTRPTDWGSREKHPLMNAWRGLIRYRAKQVCEEWQDFWVFVNDVKERPKGNVKFRPVDASAEIGPGNFHWVESATTTTEEERIYLREWAREDRKRNPDKYREKSLMKNYGIGLDEYNEMLDGQNGVCAICLNKETATKVGTKEVINLAVDHCHETGKVRGLLCTACNTAIGLLKDNQTLLQGAIDYLKRTN